MYSSLLFISGGTFVTLTKIFLQLPMNIYLYAMLPAVALVALLGAVAGQLLYLPAFKIFNAKLNKMINIFFARYKFDYSSRFFFFV